MANDNISRAEYQKVCDENKRLLRDLRIIVEGKFSEQKFATLRRWSEHFRKNRVLVNSLADMLSQTVDTADKAKVYMTDGVWVAEITELPDLTKDEEAYEYKYHPVRRSVMDALNDNADCFYFYKQNCQLECDRWNNIEQI